MTSNIGDILKGRAPKKDNNLVLIEQYFFEKYAGRISDIKLTDTTLSISVNSGALATDIRYQKHKIADDIHDLTKLNLNIILKLNMSR